MHNYKNPFYLEKN